MTEQNQATYSTIQFFASRFPDLDFSAIETCVRFMNVARTLTEAFDAHFSRHSLSRGRFIILLNLMKAQSQNRTLAPADLATSCGVTRATVTGLLDTLESAKLIERVPVEDDRRTLHVRLTAEGQAHLDSMLPDHYQRIAQLMEALDGKERTHLLKALNKIEAAIPKLRDP